MIKKIDKIFEIFESNNPNPKTELEFNNNFTLSVAVILSAQSTDVSVNKATKKLFVEYNSPEKILKLGENGLKEYIKTIGLYNSKARNIIAMSKILIDKFDSKIPNNIESLISLPGIGRKTANVILSCGFGHITMPVDTHVNRVANRIGLSNNDNPNKVEKDLIKKIPKKWLSKAHHWLVLHGRYVCKARKPLCDECEIKKYCNFIKRDI